MISANKDSLQVVYKPETYVFNSFDHLIEKEYLPTQIQHWQYQVIHIVCRTPQYWCAH